MSSAAADDAVRKAKVDVAIGYEQRADAAAAAVLRRLLDVIRDDLPGAVEGEESEYLHQLRIAVRRSRTVQRQLAGVFDALDLPGYRADFRWLQRATGEARDLDVSVSEFDALRALAPGELRDDLEPLRRVLAARRLAARSRTGAVLLSARVGQLLDDWERVLESLVELPIDARPDARRSIGSLAAERTVAVYETIVARGAEIDEATPAGRYHALRKTGKELRYLLELFGPRLFDGDVVASLIATLKDLQDLLGRHQDREVQVAMLGGLVDEVARQDGGPAACLAMGVLSDRLREDELAARREFRAAFARLASADRRVAVLATFR